MVTTMVVPSALTTFRATSSSQTIGAKSGADFNGFCFLRILLKSTGIRTTKVYHCNAEAEKILDIPVLIGSC